MKRSLIVSLFAVLLLLLVAPAFAGTSTITGTLTSANGLPNGRPDDDDNACTDSLRNNTSYYYELKQIQVSVSGDYRYRDVGFVDDSDATGTIDISTAFYTGSPSSFDPSDPLGNGCFANFDDQGTVNLTAGVNYTLMISSHRSDITTGFFILSLNGPGNILSDAALSNPMLIDGRINGQQGAPVVLYCEGNVTHGLDVNGQVLFSVENGKSSQGAWGSIAPRADGRMLVTAAFPDTKPYYFLYDGCAHGHYEALSGNPATVFDSGDY